MTINDARLVLDAKLDANEITAAEYTVACRALDKMEYRAEYNQRPEVKAKRAEYMKTRREQEKMGRQLLSQLLRK